MSEDALSAGYAAVFSEVRESIHSAQGRAVRAVNSELVLLYWRVGCIVQERAEWGSRFIVRLSEDIRREFPDMKGFSERNIKYMKKFAELVPSKEIVQTLSAQISWSHVTVLLERVGREDARMWYAKAAGEFGWSVRMLEHEIDVRLFERQGGSGKLTNFKRVLPEPQAGQALSAVKDMYVFDFLSLGQEFSEAAVERELVSHVTRMLLEFGNGFAFVGRQVHLEVGGDDFYVDLLFYHLRLHCYVVVDLKSGKFSPEQAGKMNFYLSAVDDLIRSEGDNPSIGLVLCRKRNKVVAEYALRDVSKPIGVSEYRFVSDLPEELRGRLPDAGEFSDSVVREMGAVYNKKRCL